MVDELRHVCGLFFLPCFRELLWTSVDMKLRLTSVELLWCFSVWLYWWVNRKKQVLFILPFYVFSSIVAPTSSSCKCISQRMVYDQAFQTISVIELLKTHNRTSLSLTVEVCCRFSVLVCEVLLMIAASSVAKLGAPGRRRWGTEVRYLLSHLQQMSKLGEKHIFGCMVSSSYFASTLPWLLPEQAWKYSC